MLTTSECVTTVTFQLSKYNENLKPFAGTCADYEKVSVHGMAS
jgi:hypothetical protein